MKRKSWFLKLFLLLILFITVPVILIAGIISYEMTKYSLDEISKSAIKELKASDQLTRFTADGLAQRALELTKDDSLDDMIGLMRYSQILDDPNEMMKIYSLQDRLIDLASSSASLHSVYLYMEGSDYLVTSAGTQEIAEFTDTDWMDNYNRMKETNPGSNWMLTRTVKYSKNAESEINTSNKVITFFYDFTPYTTSIRGVMVFNVYESAIRKMVNSDASMGNGYKRIISTDGYVVSDIDDRLIGGNLYYLSYIRTIMGGKGTEGSLDYRDRDGKLLVSYYKSDYNDWIYLDISNSDKLMEQVNRLRAYILYVCLFLILAGILVSWFASKKIYRPLNNLLVDIRQKKGIDITSTDSEMAVLSKAYSNLLNDRDRLSFIIDHKDNNKTLYLNHLLLGKNEEYLDKELTGIEFPFRNFLCAVICIDRYNDFETAYSKEQQEYMRMFLLKISEELLNAKLKCAGMIHEKKKIALVINYEGGSDQEVREALLETFRNIQNETGKILDNPISVGIGNCQKGVEGIGESFVKAQEALRYKLIRGCGSIIAWEESTNEDLNYYYPFVHEKYIFNILNAGAKERLQPVIAELIQYIREIDEIQYDNVIQIFNQLIGNTIKYLLEEHCPLGLIFGDNFSIYSALSSNETLDDIQAWLVEIYSKIVEYLDKKRDQVKNHFESALEYIHKNYRKDVDPEKVAEYAGISYSYLRKIFRNETGENVTNYINNLRINESKRLLRLSDKSVREISSSLGYNNDQSFIRFFKRMEGITPGEFRASGK